MICLLTAISSCTIVDTEIEPLHDEDAPVAVEFATGLLTPPSTRVGGENGDTWAQGDSVGVFMVRPGGSLESIVSNANNYHYRAAASGTGIVDLAPVNDTIYYPTTGDVNFILYYPYTSSLTGNDYRIDLGDQGDQGGLDFMYVHDTKPYNRHTAGKVEVKLEHKLTKLVFVIRSAAGSTGPSLSGMTLGVGNVMSQTTFNLSTGSLTDLGLGGSGVIQAKVNPMQGDSIVAEAIVLPVADLRAHKMVIHLKTFNQEYYADLPLVAGSQGIVGGNKYVYQVLMDISRVELSGTLVPWGDIDGGHIDFEDVLPPPPMPTPIEWVHINKGSFLLGGNPALNVTLTKDYFIGKYEITNDQYAAFMNARGIGSNGQGDVTGYGNQLLLAPIAGFNVSYQNNQWVPEAGKGNCPAVGMTWYGAKAFADWMGCSLPTEAQWEYACRAGTTTRWYFGATADNIDNYEWTIRNSGGVTHPVGQKQPNLWGVYDMCGNVAEVCSDWFGPYTSDNLIDPSGSANDLGEGHSRRGSFFAHPDNAEGSISSARGSFGILQYYNNTGLRLVYNP
jgi:formylglycine-generating enzyme required for sulfatase activity